MAKYMRLVNGVPRTFNVDGEVNVNSGVTSITVNFPANVGTADPKVKAWLINTSDANPQFQEAIVTARSATQFTASWNAPTDSANYKLLYLVSDGYVS